MDMLLFIYMESQQNEIESVIAPLKKVTPVIKVFSDGVVYSYAVSRWVDWVYLSS